MTKKSNKIDVHALITRHLSEGENYAAIKELVRDNSSVINSFGREDSDFPITPLCYACFMGRQEMVEFFLSCGADPNKAKPMNRPPLLANCSRVLWGTLKQTLC